MTNDNYRTPADFKAQLAHEFHFMDFDPCPINQEGLRVYDGETKWPKGDLFINPPYSEPAPWITKAIEHAQRGNTVVMLLRGDTSTKWFHELVLPNAEIRFVKGRIRFNGEPAPFASIIAIFYPQIATIARLSQENYVQVSA